MPPTPIEMQASQRCWMYSSKEGLANMSNPDAYMSLYPAGGLRTALLIWSFSVYAELSYVAHVPASII